MTVSVKVRFFPLKPCASRGTGLERGFGFETRREYVPVGSTAASLPQTVPNPNPRSRPHGQADDATRRLSSFGVAETMAVSKDECV